MEYDRDNNIDLYTPKICNIKFNTNIHGNNINFGLELNRIKIGC